MKIPPCGLCGKSKKPRLKTACCGHWVCGNERDYVLFSYSRNICSRNHRRYTLCVFHHTEEHKGDWKICKECRESFEHELEMYVWYGMNEYNFEKLLNPPAFRATHCSKCHARIVPSQQTKNGKKLFAITKNGSKNSTAPDLPARHLPMRGRDRHTDL